MNGYFQLSIDKTKTDIMIFPPTDGGAAINVKELNTYLARHGINYDVSAVLEAVKSGKQEVRTLVFKEIPFAEETLTVIVTKDKMQAYIRLIPPSNHGTPLTKEAVLHQLKMNDITGTVDDSAIEAMLKDRHYCTNYLIASGVEPIQGTDARIEYAFNCDIKARPTLNEDGSVDFFNLNALNSCETGDLLATLIPEVPGKSGYNVVGTEIYPREVKKAILKYGRNIRLSEDELRVYSEVSGHVSLVEGKIFVSNLYTVENVDTSTGNVLYDGNVLVNGNVCSGFSVIAKGNVEVKGIVEGARIEADGDIIIARGMNGRGKGILKAGGNIIAKYFENATVDAGGYIETEAIMHCETSSGSQVNVVGKRGYIIGGNTVAFEAVNVKNLGSSMGGTTNVKVGFQPARVNRIAELEALRNSIKKEHESTAPTLRAIKDKICAGVKLLPEQLEQFKRLAEDARTKQEMYLSAEKEINAIKMEMSTDNASVVTVSSTVYPGTVITMSNLTYTVASEVQYCKFKKMAGEIKMQPL